MTISEVLKYVNNNRGSLNPALFTQNVQTYTQENGGGSEVFIIPLTLVEGDETPTFTSEITTDTIIEKYEANLQCYFQISISDLTQGEVEGIVNIPVTMAMIDRDKGATIIGSSIVDSYHNSIVTMTIRYEASQDNEQYVLYQDEFEGKEDGESGIYYIGFYDSNEAISYDKSLESLLEYVSDNGVDTIVGNYRGLIFRVFGSNQDTLDFYSFGDGMIYRLSLAKSTGSVTFYTSAYTLLGSFHPTTFKTMQQAEQIYEIYVKNSSLSYLSSLVNNNYPSPRKVLVTHMRKVTENDATTYELDYLTNYNGQLVAKTVTASAGTQFLLALDT